MTLRLLFVLLGMIILNALPAQSDTLQLTMEEVVAMAQNDAPDVQIAKTFFSNSYWRYRSFQADFRPQIVLGATLPNINRSIESITLPDGSEKFISRSLMSNYLDISLLQELAFTGGSLFVSTGLQRLDIFATDGNARSTSYLSNPISIGFIQPVFGFNQMKWNRLVQPLVFEEAERGFTEDVEQVAYEAANLFFDVLISQLNLEAAIRDKANADTLYAISKGRYDVGRIAETELLQIELNAMNADADLAQSMLALQTSMEQLRDFLGIRQGVVFQLKPPVEIPDFMVDADKAIASAKNNRAAVISFERRLAEAGQEVAQAKANSGPNLNLNLSFGLSQVGPEFSDAYRDPLDQERLRVGIDMPIADWGKSKSRLEIARSNEELTRLQIDQERIRFEREILIKVQQFDLVRNQVRLALRAYEVAQRRLDLTRQRYRIGKILVIDLNNAIQEEAAGRRSYISALRNFWVAYYDLRRLTLYDFQADESLLRNPGAD